MKSFRENPNSIINFSCTEITKKSYPFVRADMIHGYRPDEHTSKDFNLISIFPFILLFTNNVDLGVFFPSSSIQMSINNSASHAHQLKRKKPVFQFTCPSMCFCNDLQQILFFFSVTLSDLKKFAPHIR